MKLPSNDPFDIFARLSQRKCAVGRDYSSFFALQCFRVDEMENIIARSAKRMILPIHKSPGMNNEQDVHLIESHVMSLRGVEHVTANCTTKIVKVQSFRFDTS